MIKLVTYLNRSLVKDGSMNLHLKIFPNTLDFSSNRNIIGYDWKTFDIDAGYYTVNENIVYIIKNVDDFYFKLRFIDFYDDNGAKGTPTFEYKLL